MARWRSNGFVDTLTNNWRSSIQLHNKLKIMALSSRIYIIFTLINVMNEDVSHYWYSYLFYQNYQTLKALFCNRKRQVTGQTVVTGFVENLFLISVVQGASGVGVTFRPFIFQLINY